MMMKNRWGISTALFPDFNEQALEAVCTAGFGGVECVLRGETAEDRENELAKCAHLTKSGDIELRSVHIPFGAVWDPSSEDEDQRHVCLRNVRETLQQIANTPARLAVLHGSWEPVSDDRRAFRLMYCRQSIEELSLIAEKLGIVLALEVLPRSCLGNCALEIEHVTENTPCQICFDVNHLLRDTHHDFIQKLGKKIATTHLSDYDGVDECHWIPHHGVIDWSLLAKDLKTVGYNGPLTYEISYRRFPVGQVPTASAVFCSLQQDNFL